MSDVLRGAGRQHPTTEKLYRKELRPVLRRGAKAMDDLSKAHQEASEAPNLPPRFNENQTER
jgi:hypothetical protein